METCNLCGGTVLMRYPGNDPECGPARPLCPNGHGFCEACGAETTDSGDMCGPCIDAAEELMD